MALLYFMVDPCYLYAGILFSTGTKVWFASEVTLKKMEKFNNTKPPQTTKKYKPYA